MSYLSLLFSSATQGMSNAFRMIREIEPEVHVAPEAAESVCDRTGNGADNYQLPSGIASLEHWLDLNA